MMLSRHAESLFWLGRYLERAEYSTRMLDVTYHSLLESAAWESERAWRDLLQVLRTESAFDTLGSAATSEAVNRFVMIDTTNPDSVMACIERARESARSVRELIPTELWQSLNLFYLALQGRDLGDDLSEQPYDLYELIKQRCQTVSGVLADTMARDDGWRFATIGRYLERAQMVCRLLATRYQNLGDVSFHQWLAALKSASAAESFRKAYRGSSDPADVIEFLLLSSVFPRSVFFCLRQAENELDILGAQFGRVTRPQRLLGRIRAGLEFAEINELLQGDLRAHLAEVESDIRWVSESIALEYFRNSHEFAPFVPTGPVPLSSGR
jgi:uncharacterized alpha-E superfamily protein